ncbi:MAG TPA: EAL domain-containing protein [Amycolatopsis sp.]|uniref:putative bifunctional diguanylate cyclase/phosphodiesterase n=1 Tax=Amycolatopsis sp. TaxID=37632 RepID=UPI002B459715|nr:EAL domain-containing protein [Amycolatopsis sp.]HKS49609.1 EAL domain-containing protein [Amycolatopsis sp.]
MTAPAGDGSPPLSGALISAAEAERGRFLLARKWAYVISTTAYLPLTHAEIEQHLLHLVNRLFDAMLSDPFEPAPAARVGARLVEMQCVGRDSIRRSVEVLGKSLLDQPEFAGLDRLAERVVVVLGAMMAGYSETLRQVTQRRQEGLNQSLHQVSETTWRTGLIGQARFDEVFASSPNGIALVDLDGAFLRVNEPLTGMFGRSAAELADLTVFDVVDQQSAGLLREAYEDVVAGNSARFRQTCRLAHGSDDEDWVSVTASLIRDSDGHADHFVLVVEADSEVSLLQRRLTHQALHDALTGLPNRQFFRTRLESALRQVGPKTGITLYHLDLDGFSLTSNGLGHEIGDLLLKTVADRLKAAVADQDAIVARLGSDEFGIVVTNTPATPDVMSMVERFQNALSEPVYVDGEHGLAASVSVGVVHRPAPGTKATELLRAADITVRRAKCGGRGQWQLFDPPQDVRDKETFRLAASMPGAWENGEIGVVYRPVVRLADDRQVGVEAALSWNHPGHGRLPHEKCVALAERTGLMVPLGKWLLSSAGEHVRSGAGDLRLSVKLTAGQAADPDLVGAVRGMLDQAAFRPDRLELLFPTRTLDGERGDTMDNIMVLADIGVATTAYGFGAAGDVAFLEGLPLRAIRIAPELVARRAARQGADHVIDRVLRSMVEICHRSDVQVSVDGVDTPEQAGFWREIGADVALGKAFAAWPSVG